MKKIFIIFEIGGQHYKSWFEDLTKEKKLIDGTKHYETTINFTSEELIEKIVKHMEVKDMILSYLKEF